MKVHITMLPLCDFYLGVCDVICVFPIDGPPHLSPGVLQESEKDFTGQNKVISWEERDHGEVLQSRNSITLTFVLSSDPSSLSSASFQEGMRPASTFRHLVTV